MLDIVIDLYMIEGLPEGGKTWTTNVVTRHEKGADEALYLFDKLAVGDLTRLKLSVRPEGFGYLIDSLCLGDTSVLHDTNGLVGSEETLIYRLSHEGKMPVREYLNRDGLIEEAEERLRKQEEERTLRMLIEEEKRRA